MNEYEIRQEARKERYQELAEKNKQASQSAFSQAHNMADQIPMGQPILIGHHSEKRHRRHLERIDGAMRRGVEAEKKAAYYRGKSAGVGTAGISSDDPDAPDKIAERIAELEEKQERYKAINAILRSAPKYQNTPEKIAKLVALGLTETTAAKAFEKDCMGIPDYLLKNNNANIRRLKQRLAAVQNKPTETVERATEVCTIVENADENRVQLLFPSIPPAEVRDVLKRHGFRWSRYNQAWQRHLNSSGRAAARYAVERITEMQQA